MVERMQLSGLVRELAQHCELRACSADRVVLCLPPAHRHLQSKIAQDRLQQSLSRLLGGGGQRPHLHIDVADTLAETPAAQAVRARREAQDEAVQAIESDPVVRELIELLDASLNESSIARVDN